MKWLLNQITQNQIAKSIQIMEFMNLKKTYWFSFNIYLVIFHIHCIHNFDLFPKTIFAHYFSCTYLWYQTNFYFSDLREEVDWEKEMRDFRKAATDALFKDIGDAVDDVDFEPIKDTTLDFLKHTRDILQSVDWNMFRAAGKRVMEAGKDSISEIHEKVSREPKSE